MAVGQFVLWMLPWTAIALGVLYAGYAAYAAAKKRERAELLPPPGPDPVLELESMNTEIARLATQSRKSAENARDAMQRGLRG